MAARPTAPVRSSIACLKGPQLSYFCSFVHSGPPHFQTFMPSIAACQRDSNTGPQQQPIGTRHTHVLLCLAPSPWRVLSALSPAMLVHPKLICPYWQLANYVRLRMTNHLTEEERRRGCVHYNEGQVITSRNWFTVH
jgi:hypothetical protein